MLKRCVKCYHDHSRDEVCEMLDNHISRLSHYLTDEELQSELAFMIEKVMPNQIKTRRNSNESI
ncbi:hypothetical protein [Baia soyae]|uniref:Uncharacterized protein n=1 Tax=Baia soyae TaxID=1544746 RepID=A0A4R2RFV7_9BACL|nr:hypothetical protein [Baia soyae]TCP61239.1 hypothetical protein EDD57_1645 [Baia soyae]